MTANVGSGHPGGSLSAADLMTCLFFNHMHVDPKHPDDPDRDRFVLSKGHAAPCYYAVLAEMGFISRDEFKNFRQLHSILQGHPDSKKVPGVDAATGSLGQGCSIAVGMALGAKLLRIMTLNAALSFPFSVFESHVNIHERYLFLKAVTMAKSVLSPLISIPLLLLGFRVKEFARRTA